MRTPVKCLNCGVDWLRVIVWGPDTELNDDLMYNCPACGSNYFEALTTNKPKDGKVQEERE